LPQPNPNGYAGKSDANGYSYGYIYAGKSDADGYSNSNGNNHTTSDYADTDTIGDPASADAKAAANAVSTAYAIALAGSR
jgi:hypothetical protein